MNLDYKLMFIISKPQFLKIVFRQYCEWMYMYIGTSWQAVQVQTLSNLIQFDYFGYETTEYETTEYRFL